MPSVGGIETVSKLLVHEFLKAEHEVRVVTFTPGQTEADYPILRLSRDGTGQSELAHWMRWCDVFFQNQFGLRMLGLWVFARKPLVDATHTWLKRGASPSSCLKRSFLHCSHRVYASRALELQVGLPGKVIYNPYEKSVFCLPKQEMRDRDLIFVGRLVSDKGLDILLRALRQIVDEGLSIHLTVVGNGVEREKFFELSRNLGLKERVTFRGELCGESLTKEMRRHRILVVPSLWNEPFGLVAVEAIACGCGVVGSGGGGLSEAIGPCGETFPNGDVDKLTASLIFLLAHPERLDKFRAAAPAHLTQFSPEISAAQYLDLFASCASG
jgi:glycogen(starch) synthase